MSFTPLEIARVAALAADEQKASDILLIDLPGKSEVCDYFLVMTAQNRRLADAVIDEMVERVRVNCDVKPLSVEGRAEGTWILLDYGPVVIHAFTPEARAYYRLERLWGDAPRVSLGLEGELVEAEPGGEEPEELSAEDAGL